MGEIEVDEFIHEAIEPNSIETFLGVKENHRRTTSLIKIVGDKLRELLGSWCLVL